MKIASWNVNSVKARLPLVLDWLQKAAPDVALFQEIKTVEEGFPFLEFESLGYHVAVQGQKSYNGVAILSKYPLENIRKGLPGREDDGQARYIEAEIKGLTIGGIYAPNGNPVPSEKYDNKLAWMEKLTAHARALLRHEKAFVLGGDYNVIPEAQDVYNPAGWIDDALFRPETRAAYRKLVNLGLTDALRVFRPVGHDYTFWDYQAGAWAKDHGLRIDHLLLSPQAADRLKACEVDRSPRAKEKASDHTPIWCEIEI
jgi:exodeoxyribonuclease-3